jgi:hypothetical protein
LGVVASPRIGTAPVIGPRTALGIVTPPGEAGAAPIVGPGRTTGVVPPAREARTAGVVAAPVPRRTPEVVAVTRRAGARRVVRAEAGTAPVIGRARGVVAPAGEAPVALPRGAGTAYVVSAGARTASVLRARGTARVVASPGRTGTGGAGTALVPALATRAAPGVVTPAGIACAAIAAGRGGAALAGGALPGGVVPASRRGAGAATGIVVRGGCRVVASARAVAERGFGVIVERAGATSLGTAGLASLAAGAGLRVTALRARLEVTALASTGRVAGSWRAVAPLPASLPAGGRVAATAPAVLGPSRSGGTVSISLRRTTTFLVAVLPVVLPAHHTRPFSWSTRRSPLCRDNAKRAAWSGGPFRFWFVFGGVLLSHTVSGAVPSALEGLTSGFGMGPGVSPAAMTTETLVETSTSTPLNRC